MSNDLIAVTAEYKPVLAPMVETFGQLLRPVGMDPDRLVNSCMIAVAKTPQLRQCPAHTIANAVMTGAVLGLEMDGVTGQGYIIPRKNKGQCEAQFQPGYKGGVTTAARAGFSINMAVVREGDQFDYELGSDPKIRHVPKLGEESRRKIIAAWASASAPNRAPYIEILSLDQLLETKARAAAGSSGFSPWNDPKIGFPAMCAKTASLRLRLPHVPVMALNQYGLASAVDITTEERGLGCHLTPDGELITDGRHELAETQPPPVDNPADPIPDIFIYKSRGEPVPCAMVSDWSQKMETAIGAIKTAANLRQFRAINIEHIEQVVARRTSAEEIDRILDMFDDRLRDLDND